MKNSIRLKVVHAINIIATDMHEDKIALYVRQSTKEHF